MTNRLIKNERRHDIEYSRAIADTGSFQKAAEKLHLTQSAISQFVAKIERECGATLLNRAVRPVTFTEQGRYWLEVEEAIEDLRRRRNQYFADDAKTLIGSLKIGTNVCRTVSVLGDVLGEFAHLYPNVEVELIEGPMTATDEKLLRGEVDFSLTLESLLTAEMDYEPLADENILIALHPGHPLADRGVRTAGAEDYPPANFSDFAQDKFILLKRGPKFHDGFYQLCAKHHVAPHVIAQTNAVSSVLELVGKGVGCGLVPDTLVAYQPVPKGTAFLSLQHEFPRNRVVAAWSRKLYLSKCARTFIDMLKVKQHALLSPR